MPKSQSFSTYAVSLLFDDDSAAQIREVMSALAAAMGKEATGGSGAQANGTGQVIPASTAATGTAGGQDVPPHLTLGMFRAASGDEDRLLRAFGRFAAEAGRSFDVTFGGADDFCNRVIFLSIDKDDSFGRLKDLNVRLHEIFCDFEPGDSRRYVAENWLPHVTLAAKLSKKQFDLGMQALGSGCARDTPRCGVSVRGNLLYERAMRARDSSGAAGVLERPEGAEECSAASAEPRIARPPLAGGCVQKNKKILLPKSARVVAVAVARCRPFEELRRVELASDVMTAAQRHNNMAAIRSKENKPEKAIRSQLFKFGFRFRKNDRRLAGSPDIVFPHFHAVIFVNGCFWHAHGWRPDRTMIDLPLFEQPMRYSQNCAKFRFPRTNSEFWRKKFERNTERDLRDITALLKEGWRVGVVWECSIAGKNRREKIYDTAAQISLWLEEGFAEAFREF